MNPFFSIVIPIYRVEEYLDECIQSILHQEYQDYEAILVDDGSPDRCGMIADAYAERYPFIRAVHKENGGLDSARKYGLHYCKGRYIIFLDSDDALLPSCLKLVAASIVDRKDSADVYQTPYIMMQEGVAVRCVDELELIFQGQASLTGRDFFTNHALFHTGFWNAWSKVYRNDYLKSLNLSVLDKYSCEDVATLWKTCYANGIFSFINIPMISFRTKREGSITNQISFEYTRGYLEQMLQIYREVNRSTIRERKRVCGVLADMYVEKCKNVRKVHLNYRSQLYDLVNGNKDILLKSLAYMKKANALYSLVGLILGFKKTNGLLSE